MKKFLSLLLFPATLFAQKNYSSELDKYVQAQADVKGFTGVVLVAKQNKILLKKAYGQADREAGVANTTDSKFISGSLTKTFTAVAILLLEDQGKLKTSDKLSKYLPGYPKGDSVTIDMLLNHTSGIANFTEVPGFMMVAKENKPIDSVISYFKNRPFTSSPGTKYRDNNSDYFLLGYLVGKISGQSYENFLRNNLFRKLNMENSGVYKDDLSKIAKGYIKTKTGFDRADVISPSWIFSAGGLYSTVDDLYKWDRSLYGNTVLSAASKQKMLTPGKGDFGYGLLIDSFNNHLRTWQSGGLPGYLSVATHFINEDISIIILSNSQIVMSNTLPITVIIADALAGILFDLPVEAPYIHKEVTIDPALLDRYVGKYRAGLTLEVIKKEGKLYRHREGSPDIELKPESSTKFFYADDSDRQLEFEVDGTGKVTKIWFINAGQRGEMMRMQ